MKIFTTKGDLQNYLTQQRSAHKTIGLVPTMGALHQGHISLLAYAKNNTDEVVCSIFVNPTQFTDPKDLEQYPRPVETDIEKLNNAGCNVLFMPPVQEMYTGNETWHLEIGFLETVLEGKFRPGHYQGVTQVVYKLFDIVKPDIAFFGQKDYQQYLVINKMVHLLKIPVKLIMCPIVREQGGLAMSSRNIRLSDTEKQHAQIISKALQFVKQQFTNIPFNELQKVAIDMINNEPGAKLEYFEIADADTLEPADSTTIKKVALTAVKVGNTRLIDNVILT